MREITIRLHPDLADRILAAGPEGGTQIASLWRQAERAVRSCGWRIDYAPAILPGGIGCADERARRYRCMVVEVDRPGMLILARGVIAERPFEPRRPKAGRR